MYSDESFHGLLISDWRILYVLNFRHVVPINHLAVQRLEPPESDAVDHGASIGKEGDFAHFQKRSNVVMPAEMCCIL